MKKSSRGLPAVLAVSQPNGVVPSTRVASGKEMHAKSDAQLKRKVDDFYIAFRRDVAAFREMLPKLLLEYPNQYVAILNGQVVAHMTHWQDLAEATQKRYPDEFVLLEQVVPKEKNIVDMDTIEG